MTQHEETKEVHEMKTFRRFVWIVVLLLASVLPASVATAERYVELPIDWTGTLNGAPFRIRVPENWNGTLLVFAHGYGRWPEPAVAPPPIPVEERLLALGYAMAGSAFRNPGMSIKEGIQNTLALTGYFRGHVGSPDRVILWGFSMGGLITQASIEKYPGIYDAGIPMCATSAGMTKAGDWYLTPMLAYDAAFGWPEAWGSVGDVRDDLVFDDDVAPVFMPQLMNPANYGLFEFIRLVSDLPAASFYPPIGNVAGAMFFATEGRAEMEVRAGGPPFQNVGHVYTLSEDEIDYLNGLGVDAEGLLATMNAQTEIEAWRPARHYMERYADLSGKIKRPVLSVHTTADGICPVFMESAYRETVAAAGQEDMLVQVYTDGVGHCAFTPQQILDVFAAMEYWLDTGTPPDDSFFAGEGFLSGYEPLPWPQPVQ